MDFAKSLIKEVAAETVTLQAEGQHSFDDIAYIVGPDIALRATEATQLLRTAIAEERETLSAAWAKFHKTSTQIIESDVVNGLGMYWTYQSDHNEGWASINSRFQVCSGGAAQSPVNISMLNVTKVSHKENAKLHNVPLLEIHYGQENGLHLLNNGHTLQVNPKGDNYILIDGERYDLLQFHFHQPSGEQVDGKHYDMVAHFVHSDKDGKLGVVAVLLDGDQQQENPLLKIVFQHARALLNRSMHVMPRFPLI